MLENTSLPQMASTHQTGIIFANDNRRLAVLSFFTVDNSQCLTSFGVPGFDIIKEGDYGSRLISSIRVVVLLSKS